MYLLEYKEKEINNYKICNLLFIREKKYRINFIYFDILK